jgi:hypothetical protein
MHVRLFSHASHATSAINLLGLLGSGGTRDVAADVSGLVALAHKTLDGLPTLADLGRGCSGGRWRRRREQ